MNPEYVSRHSQTRAAFTAIQLQMQSNCEKSDFGTKNPARNEPRRVGDCWRLLPVPHHVLHVGKRFPHGLDVVANQEHEDRHEDCRK
jgi:hypothetical protein